MRLARRLTLAACALALGAACGTANPTPHPLEERDAADGFTAGDEFNIAGEVDTPADGGDAAEVPSGDVEDEASDTDGVDGDAADTGGADLPCDDVGPCPAEGDAT